MDNKYTYGYNVGWQVENKYIDQISEILSAYNEHMETMNYVKQNFDLVATDLERYYKEPTDEELRNWYKEDNISVSFEKYKEQMLQEYADKRGIGFSKDFNDKVGQLSAEKDRRKDEYYANLYYLIDIKNETRKAINFNQRRLELELRSKQLLLDQILFNQSITTPIVENGVVTNNEQLINLRNQYDDTYLEIQKIKDALQQLSDMNESIKFTDEENALMLRGLNPQQRQVYDEIINRKGLVKVFRPSNPFENTSDSNQNTDNNLDDNQNTDNNKNVGDDSDDNQNPDDEVEDQTKEDDLNKVNEFLDLLEIYNEDLDRLYELQSKYENGEIEYSEYEKFALYMSERYEYMLSLYNSLPINKNLKYGNMSLEELQKKVSELNLENSMESHDDENLDDLNKQIEEIKKEIEEREKYPDIPELEEPFMIKQKQELVEEDKIPLHFRAIFNKVMGNEKFGKTGKDSEKQAKYYELANVKILGKLPDEEKERLKKRGNTYRVVSFIKRGFGKAITFVGKIYGKIRLKKSYKESIEEIYKRANELTDEEVEIIIEPENIVQLKPNKVFINAIKPRLKTYYNSKMANINVQLALYMANAEYYAKIASKLEERLKEENLSSEERKQIISLMNNSYDKSANYIKDIRKLSKEGDKLLKGNGEYSIFGTLKAVDNKLNYSGGRFSHEAAYDPEIRKLDEKYEDILLNPNSSSRDIVNAYYGRIDLYKENSEEKRSLLDLGSKASVGMYDYNPFVERLDYSDDTLVRDLITSIVMITTVGTLVSNIVTNIKNSAIASQMDAERLKVMGEQKQYTDFVDEVKGSKGTFENGMSSTINRDVGNLEENFERIDLDANAWKLGSKGYKASDALHHQQTGALSVSTTSEISKALSSSDPLKALSDIYKKVNSENVSAINAGIQDVANYASTHPKYDYSAILQAFNDISTNSNSVADMFDKITKIYNDSLKITPFSDLSLMSDLVHNASIIPPTLATASAATLVGHDSTKKSDAQNLSDEQKRLKQLKEKIMNMDLVSDEEIQKGIEEELGKTI